MWNMIASPHPLLHFAGGVIFTRPRPSPVGQSNPLILKYFGSAESVREKANSGCGICGYIINHPSFPDNMEPSDDFLVRIWKGQWQDIPALVTIDIFFEDFKEFIKQGPLVSAITIQAERTGNHSYSSNSTEVCERL